MKNLGTIKICPDPCCDAVYHNCIKGMNHCNNCGAILVQINEDTFWKKFSKNWFQYDALTGEYYRPTEPFMQLSLELY
jgi:hypothetical protein